MMEKPFFRTGLAIFTFLLGTASCAFPQAPKKVDAAEIQLALKKLNKLAAVLYIGAHPDDENTRLLAYLGSGELADTAYLSLTRGDGGQNLIGPEIREPLGIIRTQELLGARRIGGGKQFFTRAVDFGYSKDPDETFTIWDREKVLADTVWVIREFQPDVLITRFSTEPGVTHGHHTASAILAGEAFEAAGDPARFPEQLRHVRPWQPKRLLWNTAPWFYRNRNQPFDDSGLLKIDDGTFNPLLGKSYPEIAAESRSMHKSQGFGATGARGTTFDYLKLVKGEKAERSLFDWVDTSWNRLEGGSEVGESLHAAYEAFDPEHPARILPLLLEAREELRALRDSRWKKEKEDALEKVIYASLGLYLEVVAEDFSAVPGEPIKLKMEATNRSDFPVRLLSLNISKAGFSTAFNEDMPDNAPLKKDFSITLPENLPISQPYWLAEKGSLGMFTVKDRDLIGLPENPPALLAAFRLAVGDEEIEYLKPVVYKRNDPVEGEKYRPFYIIPPLAVNLAEKVVLFPDEKTKTVNVRLRAGKPDLHGRVRIEVPEGWRAEPQSTAFTLKLKGEEARFPFEVSPPAGESVATLRAVGEMDGAVFRKDLVWIDYDHIPVQVYFPEASARVVRLDIKRKGNRLGYIQGAGDAVPEVLRQIGYEVVELADADMSLRNFKRFDAIILGVRAYNTREGIQFYQPALMEYVRQGGTLIAQYNTSYRLKTEKIAPYPLTLSHDRVTVEEAPVRFLLPAHPVLNTPNKITDRDFDNWVQERGLYFPNAWDDHFEAILSSNDPGEPPRNGGLLIASYGEGYFIYTGYSWFRELPAGVPGAYRLFVNLISLGN